MTDFLSTGTLPDEYEQLAEGLDAYLDTLAPHWRRVVAGYTLIDIAHKVVGVGSVGLRAYVALLEGSSPDDVLFLQLKQARRSVLARYVHGGRALLGGDPQPDQRAPVLHDDGDLPQVQLGQPGRHPLDVAQVGVVLGPGRLVGAAEPDEVGGQHPMPRGGQRRNHGAVQVTPRRLAVQQHHRLAVPGALIEVVHTQRTGVARADIQVVRFEGIALEVGEAGVRGAK